MDLINTDGTFRRYYKNSNLKERGKYINNEYDGEIINYLPDGQICQKRYFNLTGKKSPTSIGGAMNCPIVF